jgi:hypothetical protein
VGSVQEVPPGDGGGAMEFWFNAEEWERFTPAQRARRCRTLAHEASEIGLKATPGSKLRRMYLDLAFQWESIAFEIEREGKLTP